MNDERDRILDMVAAGSLSPEEGDKLLEAMDRKSDSTRCPFCAEEIPVSAYICPECDTSLEDIPSGKHTRSFHTLGGMSKFLIIYMFFVCGIILLLGWGIWFDASPALFQKFLAVFGFIAAILMCKGKKEGWVMGIFWSAAQIVVIINNYKAVNLQFFNLGANSIVNGDGLGFNIVGVLLVVFFLTAKGDWN